MSLYTVVNPGSPMCRFCLAIDKNLVNIFEKVNDITLSFKASKILGIEILHENGVPDEACKSCLDQINGFDRFQKMAMRSYGIFKGNVCILRHADNEDIKQGKSADCDSLHSKEQAHESEQSYQYSTEDEQKYPTVLKALKINQCLLCLEKFDSKTTLYTHIDKHLEGTQLDPYYNIGDKNIYCEVCKKSYKYRFSYIEHQRQHLNINPFVCKHKDCGCAFNSKSLLNFHMSKHQDRLFACECGSAFKRRSDLRTHQLIHRDQGSACQCERCGKQFKNSNSLRVHIRIHERIPDHRCPHCPKQYYSRSELKRHLPAHGTEKLFACAKCRRAYNHKSALLRHQRDNCGATAKK